MSEVNPNTFLTPNVVIDKWIKTLNGSEFKLLMLITQQTFGWKTNKKTKEREKTEWISSAELCSKSGLSATSVSRALRKLEKLGYTEARNDNL